MVNSFLPANNWLVMKYLEFTFSVSPVSDVAYDVLTAVLADVGFGSFVASGDDMQAYIQKTLFDEEVLRASLRDFPMKDVAIRYTQKEAEDKDWNEEWEKNYFQPIVVDDRCVIHCTFHKDVPQAEYNIVIEPRMAFGTGHHATTSLIIAELLRHDLTGTTVLDMGCGTSILAILARMRGASSCMAIDYDEWCVKNSLENIALNHLDGINVELGDASILSGKGPYDVVIANINRNILLADMNRYVQVMHKGSVIYMSGFYVDDIPVLREKAARCGLVFEYYKEKDHWAVVKFVLA